ncbi:MAG: hypothetical protein PHW65_04150 [Dehalococcoidales bacterium]|nr:hypothetical protein [Dehalococcoidales bacterium]
MTKAQELIKEYGIELLGERLAVPKGKQLPQEVIAKIKDAKQEIIEELKGREEAERRAEETKRQEEIRAIKAGETKIKVEYHDGEYLMGWEVYGREADLLEELGLAEYVNGWGYHVVDETVKALGEEFTYQQAAEYARPALEAKEAKKQQKEQEIQAKFDEARETGKPVLLDKWMSDCHDPKEECSLDVNYEYAMPDGSTKHEWHHTW